MLKALFRFLLGVLILLVGYFIGSLPYGYWYHLEPNPEEHVIVGLFLAGCIFLVWQLCIPFIAKFIYREPYSEFLGLVPVSRHQWFQLSLILIAFLIFLDILFYSCGFAFYKCDLDLTAFIPWAICCIPIFILQASAEEFVFRGFLWRAFHLMGISSPGIIVLTSLGFAAAHSFNPEIQIYGAGMMLCYYFMTGVFLALCRIITGGLWIPVIIHILMNIYSSLIASVEGSVINGPALFTVHDPNMIAYLILTFCMYTCILWYLTRLWNVPFHFIIEQIKQPSKFLS